MHRAQPSISFQPCFSKLKILIAIFSLIVYFALTQNSFGQYIYPATQDTSKFGAGVQRTMNLLATSTPENRKTVKVLVYGQSISKQSWWLQVRDTLKKQFPHANLIMENRSIGGFAASLLKKTVDYDIMPFYPDLVIFHVYNNNNRDYQAILDSIRSKTTAEIALQNDHYNGGDIFSDNSNRFLPNLARSYRLEMMDIRTPWVKYLNDNNYPFGMLLSDNVHLNDTGSFVLAKLIQRHLAYKPKFPSDPYGLVTTYTVGEDVSFKNDTLILPFDGNKVDLISATPSAQAISANILIDGRRPSSFKEVYYFTRPNDSTWVQGYYERDPNTFTPGNRIDWPWMTGGIKKITPNTTTIEDWTITVSNYKFDGTNATFDFALEGSKTGPDGSGKVAMNSDNWTSTDPIFVSNSGKVTIDHNDWWIPQAIEGNYPYKGTEYDPKITFPFKIKWSVISRFADEFVVPTIKDPSLEHTTTVVQGISNGSHKLVIAANGKGEVPISEIRVYRPYSRRLPSTHATSIYESDFNEETIMVYPNPASNFLKVEIPMSGERIEIEIVNLLGKSVAVFDKGSQGSNLELNLTPFSAGMYIANIKIGEKIIARKFNIVK